MGQYFLAINLDKKEYLNGHDYDNGIKLMEHSYVENNYVKTFESAVADKITRIVWAGDYADEELNDSEFFEKDEDGNINTLYGSCDTLFSKIKPKESDIYYRWLINLDRKEFVDKDLIPGEEWKVHPLPLLTAEGNDRGGGDYRSNNPDFKLVGIWARDRVLVTNVDYTQKLLDKNYVQIKPQFQEQ